MPTLHFRFIRIIKFYGTLFLQCAFCDGDFMLEIKTVSSLEKIFDSKTLSCNEINSFSMLKNERLNFQAVLKSDEDVNVFIDKSSNINCDIRFYIIENVHVKFAAYNDSDDFFISKEPGIYPDLLKPIDDNFYLKKDKNKSVWIEVFNPISSGLLDLTLKFNDLSVEVKINVIDAIMPNVNFIYTNWYHADCICDYYHIKPFSDGFWRINEKFIKTAAYHGMNCILTPLFTPPLDTAVGKERTTMQLVDVKTRGGKYIFGFKNLKKWIDLCKSCGIEYFEMSHLFTQWGAKHSPKIIAKDKKGRVKRIFGWDTKTKSRKYEKFIFQFANSLNSFICRENLSDKVFFHISDEPDIKNIKTYKYRAEIVKRAFPNYPIIDALSDYDFFSKGYVDIPVPNENEIDNFYGKTSNLWTYYCCSQCRNNEPNRFITMPSVRNRVLGLLAYKYKLTGFLHWGFNFYNSQFSLEHINPFETTDAGGKFPSGDAFVVYPSDDGTVLCSLRLKVFYDALQDYKALKLLESYIGEQKVNELLGNITFNDYPHDNLWLITLRNKVNALIDDNI